MSAAAATPTQAEQQLATLFQYTVEAYKIFQKLAELLPNPMSAAVFTNFAEDERNNRDLLEIKYVGSSINRLQISLGSDLRFQDALEGDLSYRELTESLIARERTMERRLMEWARAASQNDRNLLNYLAASKRAHLVFLDRELALLKIYADWYKREDAESLIVHGRKAM
jgi:rubrerythrin